MSDIHDQLDISIKETEKAIAFIRKGTTRQLSSKDEIEYIKAVVYSWTRTHRPIISYGAPNVDLTEIDRDYSDILACTSRRTLRNNYVSGFKEIKSHLVSLRTETLVAPITSGGIDAAPNFSSLVPDRKMQEILERRWYECQRCNQVEAYLAATVMMGGLLEALFVAKANTLTDKRPLFTAVSAPKEKGTAAAKPLKDWMLNDYINVGYEVGWITKSGKGVAGIVRDYRNYIHPEKERTEGIVLNRPDADLFWEITKQLSKQLI